MDAARGTLAGFAQVFFQPHALAGGLLLLAIAINSVGQAAYALTGALAGAAGARILAPQAAPVRQGLHSFNGVLVGIALHLYFGASATTLLLVLLGSGSSIALAWLLNTLLRQPAYTMPFILLIWLALYSLPLAALPASSALAPPFDPIAATLNGLGQVMFQTGIPSGVLIFAGLLIAQPKAALLSIAVCAVSACAGYMLGAPVAAINNGLLGYNPVLAGLAMLAVGKKWQPITVACMLAFGLAAVFRYCGLPALTAPFVLAAWGTHLLVRHTGIEGNHAGAPTPK